MVVMLQAMFAVGWGLAARIQSSESATVKCFFFFNVIMGGSLFLIAFRSVVPWGLHKLLPLWFACIANYFLSTAVHRFFRFRLASRVSFWPLWIGALAIFVFIYIHYSDEYRIAAFLLAILATNLLTIVRVMRRLVAEFGYLPLIVIASAFGVLSVPIVWTSYIALFTGRAFGLTQTATLNDIAMFGLGFAVACPNLLFAALVSMRLTREAKERLLRDDVTRLFNYGAFLSENERDWSRRRQGHIRAAAIAIDLDDFVKVTLRYGRYVGDHVLRELTRILENLCEPGSIIARTGRSEFMIIARVGSMEGARAFAHRIHAEMFAANWMTLMGGPLKLTASIGIAMDDLSDTTANDLLARAEDALVLAKRQRNQLGMIRNATETKVSVLGADPNV